MDIDMVTELEGFSLDELFYELSVIQNPEEHAVIKARIIEVVSKIDDLYVLINLWDCACGDEELRTAFQERIGTKLAEIPDIVILMECWDFAGQARAQGVRQLIRQRMREVTYFIAR